MVKKILPFCVFAFLFSFVGISTLFASKSSDKTLWTKTNLSEQKHIVSDQQLPEKFLTFSLNKWAFDRAIVDMPMEFTDEAQRNPVFLDVPMPDGSIQSFRIEETLVLSPELAASLPDWKTFIGYGVDDPRMTGRFDWNVNGFHGYISSEKGTVMIDPFRKGDTDNYLVYFKHEYGKSSNEFYCRPKNGKTKFVESVKSYEFSPAEQEFSFGASVRTYRLAVATTGEWARAASGVTMPPAAIRAGALGVITTSVNRLNGIYERELASRFLLVNPLIANDATNIIFDDPLTDPYNNTDQADDMGGNVDQLRVNQETLTARVTTGAYDIGHLYGTGGGGVATGSSLCSVTTKAQGYSARGTNTGDPFTIDYVSHELGHQFGADHTYNNSDTLMTACTTRSAADAFEPASGSTIMSYVGICNNRNLQQFVDTGFSSFHIRSLTTIVNNITTGDPQTSMCGTAGAANNIPTVNPGMAFSIPTLTPFTLTAAGGDADPGDVANLLYSWEQYDLAPSASGLLGTPANTYDVDTDGIFRPLFRAYSPIAGNSRTFPSMVFVLNPANNDPAGSNQPPLTYMGTHATGFPGAVCEPAVTCVVGERLPAVARTMNFRVSVRDRRGGIVDAGTTVTTVAGGPFRVTAQDTLLAPNWQVGTMQNVTWDVAGTTAAPINAANVRILLSTDGGQTFPIVLAANALNNGAAMITVPDNPTAQARLRVEAVGNIFFDVSNVNFTIVPATAAAVSVSGRVVNSFGWGVPRALVIATDQFGNSRTVLSNSFGYYRFADVAVGGSFVFSVRNKEYQFTPRLVTINEDIADLDFVANP